jgi:hypothetical protein
MSSAAKILPHYTYHEWEQWEGQWELIEGIPYAVSPLPVPKHQKIAMALGSEFTKKYLDFPPALVLEILSPATPLKDRHNKYSIYESQGIPYYLIISPDTEEVEV